MRYALGIDGGGSKCDAVLIDETGRTVGWGRGGPVHTYYDAPEMIDASFVQSVSQALQGVQGAELWVAGNSLRGPAMEALSAHGDVVSIRPAGEVETAFASVQEEWGMVVLSGTGSFVHARTADGRSLHVGGWGPTLGDYGSGYEIGLCGIRAACAATWLKSRQTSLEKAVPRFLDVDDLHDVFRLVYVDRVVGRRQLASIAKVVDREAEKGDRIAIDCLLKAADELANLAVDVVNELDMSQTPFPVIAIGGVAQRSRIWWERMCRRIAEAAPDMRPVIPRVRPVVGAALLALREIGVDSTAELLDRIVETQEPFLATLDAAEGAPS